MTRPICRLCVAFATLIVMGSTSLAQGSSSASTDASLAEAARRLRPQKSVHPDKVFTGDEVEENDGPLPRLHAEGDDNSGDIVAAIVRYKETHSAAETEKTIHEWYDRFDQALASAIQENIDLNAEWFGSPANPYAQCQQGPELAACQKRAGDAINRTQDVHKQIKANENLIGRIQQRFLSVRRGIRQSGLAYSWFKVRTLSGTM